MRSALQHSAFRWLFLSSMVSQVGAKIQRIALLFVAFQETQNAVWVALILGSQFLASAVLGPLLGPLVDRYDRRTLMIISNLARAFLVACIPLFAMDSMPLLMVIAFLISAFSSVHYSASNSSIPDLVPTSALDGANSLMTFTDRFSEVVFVALAGVLVAGLGPAPAFWIDATTYLIATALLIRLPGLPGKAARSAYFAMVVSGVSLLWQNLVLRRTIGTLAVAAVFGSVEATLGIVLAMGVLQIGVQGFAVLEALTAIGAILGLFLAMRLLKTWSRQSVFLMGLGAFGLMLASLGFLPFVLWAGFALFVLGVANTLFIVPARSIIQLATPPDLRGRVMAAFGATMQSSVLMGTFMAGLLEPALGVLVVLMFSGIAVSAVVLLVVLRGGIPSLDTLKQPE
jgi:MFS family permease